MQHSQPTDGRSVADSSLLPVGAVEWAKPLCSILQLSLAQAVRDPITHNQQWELRQGLSRR